MNESVLSELDEQLLWELSRNARVSNSDLAKLTSVSPATVHNRLKRLKEIGVLESSHAEVDMARLGFNVQALVSVRLKAQVRSNLDALMKEFASKANIHSVYMLGGPTDLLAHVICVSTSQLHEIVTREFVQDPNVAYADAQVVYAFRRGAQHMERLSGYSDLR